MKQTFLAVLFIGGSAVSQAAELYPVLSGSAWEQTHTATMPDAFAITVSPVTVGDILTVLAATQPDPVKLTALVNGASVGTILNVMLSVAGSPEKLTALVGALTPSMLAQVATTLAQNIQGPGVPTVQEQAAVAALANAVVATADSPAKLTAIVSALSPDALLKVAAAIAQNAQGATISVQQAACSALAQLVISTAGASAKLTAVVGSLTPEMLANVIVELGQNAQGIAGASITVQQQAATNALAGVIVAIADSPAKLTSVVGSLTPQMLANVIVALGQNAQGKTSISVPQQAAVNALTSAIVAASTPTSLLKIVTAIAQSTQGATASVQQQASVNALAGILVSAATTPDRLNAVVGAINSPDLLFQVVTTLANSAPSPTVFAQVVKSNPRIEVTVMTLDLSRWIAVRGLTEEMKVYGGNWLGAAIQHLRGRVVAEGYSDGVMNEFQQIKDRLSQPAISNTKGSDTTNYR